MPTPDGLRIPAWIAGPLVAAATIARATGLITANGLASDVEAVQGEQERAKSQAQDVRERVIRIEEQIKQVKEEQTKQSEILDDIKKAVERPR